MNCCQAALRVNPRDVSLHYNLGLVLEVVWQQHQSLEPKNIFSQTVYC